MSDKQPGGGFDSETSATFNASGGPLPSYPVGVSIGGFRILGLLGQGGMGTVYRAQQERPHREVALKLVRAGLATTEVLRRFEMETEVLGRLQHPGIAQIYEVGVYEGDVGEQPFFAMELVEGRALTEWALERELTLNQKLELFTKICDAVEHAHQKEVIHRDLKPSNLMVSEEGHPKILDFGVARVTESDLQATFQTDIGQLVGTLPYMSPEQVVANPDDLDTRSDVYSLGVVLYELVSGRLPYLVRRTAMFEAARTIREEDPTPLSSIDTRFRGDLETIALKALEKDKDRRYASAADFAADIRRFLADEPIVARPATRIYQLQKFTRRHKGLVFGLAFSFLVLLVATIVSLNLALEESRQRQSAVDARQELQVVADAQTKLALEEARQRRLAEEARAQIETVASFQSKMLRDIDAPSMGNRIVTLLRREVDRALASRKLEPEEHAAILTSFDDALEGVNRTGIALSLLDETFLDPSVTAVGEQFADQPSLELSLRRTLGEIFLEVGLYGKGEEERLRALALRQQIDGDGPPNDGLQRVELAEAYLGTGKYSDAEEILRPVLKEDRGGGEALRLRAQDYQGRVLLLQGKMDEARRILEPTLERQVELLGEENKETLATMNDLAMVYSDTSEFDRAEAMYLRMLSGYDPGEDLATARVRLGVQANLAWTYLEQERTDESIALGKVVLEERRRLLGETHPDTLQSENNLAVAYRMQGQYDLAEPLYRHDLETSRALLGREHPELIATMSNFGRFLVETGQLEEAKTHLEETLALHTKVMPPGFFGKGYTYQTYAECLKQMKRHPEARAALLEAWKILLPVLGPEDHSITWIINSMVENFEAEGNEAGAEEWRGKLADNG
ncbi:MAG: tetratricopeptide repeat protein [Planctomycetota bacterium]